LKPTDAFALISPRELRRYRPADDENVEGVKIVIFASRVPAYLAIHESNFPSAAWPKLLFRKRLPTPFPNLGGNMSLIVNDAGEFHEWPDEGISRPFQIDQPKTNEA